MEYNPHLHHYCQNIARGYLNDVLEMYSLLNFKVVYTPPNGDWAMVGQEQLHFTIQITQVDASPLADIDRKKQTHIAFLSDDPRKVISKVENWAKDKDIKFREGSWSDKERYFDLPDIFINFVVEVMHSSIEEE